MAGKDQKRLQKKKKRELNVKKKLAVIRDGERAKKKEILEAHREHKKIQKFERAKQELEKFSSEFLNKLPEDTRSQIEHNWQILKALEEEYRKELDKRGELNRELEAKGYHTPEEKMAYLQQQALNEAQKRAADKDNFEKAIGTMSGGADASFNPNVCEIAEKSKD